MDVDADRVAFRGSPMKRAKLPGMKRNAAVAHGNVGSSAAVEPPSARLRDERNAWVRPERHARPGHPPGDRYSTRIATVGSTRSARRVGTTQASRHTPTMNAT